MQSTASINRVMIIDLPGLTPEPEVRGCTGSDLLGAEAVAALVRETAKSLGLVDHRSAPARELLPRFDRCFTAADETVRQQAEAIAQTVGRRLGYHLLTLKRGDAVNRAARHDWDARHWAWWAGMRHVWIGGGLASGELGTRLPGYAQAVLAEHASTDLRVARSPYGAALPQTGAARALAPTRDAGLVFDFGGSLWKRALAQYDVAGRLAALHVLPPQPAPPDLSGGTGAAFAARLADELAAFIAGTWAQVAAQGTQPAPEIGVVLATYLRSGAYIPPVAKGYYALHQAYAELAGQLARLVTAQLKKMARTGQPVTIRLWHDGTAAALPYAGAGRAAVIQLGTALGVGFPPEDEAGLRPFAPGFAVVPG